jgi:hypothetical protein
MRSISGLQSLKLSSCLELGDDDPLRALAFLTGTTATPSDVWLADLVVRSPAIWAATMLP